MRRQTYQEQFRGSGNIPTWKTGNFDYDSIQLGYSFEQLRPSLLVACDELIQDGVNVRKGNAFIFEIKTVGQKDE
jgi:hypothetical protein